MEVNASRAIMSDNDLPFKVGQSVELKSFLKGYRGAWFRSEIKQFGMRKYDGKVEKACALEYFDFPDEKVKWTKLYQKRSKYAETQLVIRPSFPPVYCNNMVVDVAVIVNDVWKVGDLVDWWTDNCFWSGTVTKVLGKDKFQFELFPPPDGEGLTYEVLGKDLRPSLDWSLEHGWTVPKGNTKSQSCAHLIKSSTEVNPLPQQNGSKETEERPMFSNSWKVMQTPLEDVHANVTDGVTCRTSCFDNELFRQGRAKSADATITTGTRDSELKLCPAKIIRADGSDSSNSTYSSAIETSIVDMEELVHRIKWMKSFLDFGGRNSDPTPSKWQYLEHREAPASK